MMEQLVNPYKKYYAHFPKGVHINCSNCPNAFEEGINQGRKEVVKWVEGMRLYWKSVSTTKHDYYIPLSLADTWQSKLKEWGL